MKISVIIPVYNCAKYIAQTLDCIRFQTMPQNDLEVLVYLDGCTDNTENIVRNYTRQYRDINIRVMSGAVSVGPGAVRNKMAKLAKGEYIHFMDSDDFLNLDFYAAMYRAARDCDADVAVCNFICERDDSQTTVYDKKIVVSAPLDKVDVTRVDELGYSFRYLIRRDFWKNAKVRYPTDMKVCEDLLPMNQVVLFANRIVTAPDATYVYKNRVGSLLNDKTMPDVHRADYHRAMADVAAFLRRYGLSPRPDKSYWTYYRVFGVLPIFSKKTTGKRSRFMLFKFIPLLRVTH